MTCISSGRVNVATPGTAVPLAATHTPCCRIRAQVIAGLTGKMYLGTRAVVGSTLAGAIKEFWPNPAGGIDDSFEIWTADGGNGLDLADYAIDAAVAGEGLIVARWVE